MHVAHGLIVMYVSLKLFQNPFYAAQTDKPGADY